MTGNDVQPPGGGLAAAAKELRYLLGRGYPREKVLTLVGDRHRLVADERELLRRGVFAPQTAARRKAGRLGLNSLGGLSVAVDGHNQIITLEAALRGARLVLADDGWVRDVSRLGRNHKPDRTTRRAARLMLSSLAAAGARNALIWLDAPLPRSGELAAWLRDEMNGMGLAGGARALPVPEKELIGHPGPVASSDGAVIDKVDAPLDLAGEIVMRMDPAPKLERFLDGPCGE